MTKLFLNQINLLSAEITHFSQPKLGLIIGYSNGTYILGWMFVKGDSGT